MAIFHFSKLLKNSHFLFLGLAYGENYGVSRLKGGCVFHATFLHTEDEKLPILSFHSNVLLTLSRSDLSY